MWAGLSKRSFAAALDQNKQPAKAEVSALKGHEFLLTHGCIFRTTAIARREQTKEC